MARAMVGDESAVDRLMRYLSWQRTGVESPTREQVALVLHALADHTAIMAALDYRRPADSPWPESVSLGRWFHDTVDDLADSPR